MTTYTYSATYVDTRGHICKVGFGTEAAMMNWAVAIDRMGYELLDAVREVWEEANGVAHFLRVEQYKMGRPE